MNWETRFQKHNSNQKHRKILAKEFLKPEYLNRTVRALTLPADKWVWERDLASKLPHISWSFHGVELDKSVWKRMKKNIPVLKNCPTPTVCKSPQSFYRACLDYDGVPFDIIYADWCGTWNKDTYQEVETIFKRGLLSESGFLMITIQIKRGCQKGTFITNSLNRIVKNRTIVNGNDKFPLDEYSAEIIGRCPQGHRKAFSVSQHIEEIALRFGYKLSLSGLTAYAEDQPGVTKSPMLTMTFKVDNYEPKNI